MKASSTTGYTRDEARDRLRPGNFQGRPPRERPHQAEDDALAAIGAAEGRWFETGRYRRRARITSVTPLTATGTVRIGFEVVDGAPFNFEPGQFVGIEAHFAGLGYRRSPYCILSAPREAPTFDLLVRVVPGGPLSNDLASRVPGDEVAFRGPTGRSMVPRDDNRALALFATGTGVAPFFGLADHLLRSGYTSPITLWWGLRLEDDLCLTDELDALAAGHPNFRYHVTLTQPGPSWAGRRGRVTESAPPTLAALGSTRYYLAGNGAMVEQLAAALSDLGVDRKYIYKEAFFDLRHQPDPHDVADVRERFVAKDLYSAYANRRGTVFDPDLDAARTGKAGNGDPMAVSDLFDLMPAFLSHHPAGPSPRRSSRAVPGSAPSP